VADIDKKPAKIRDSKYKRRAIRRRGSDLALAARLAELNAQGRINKYSRSSKLDRREKDLDLFERIDPSKRNAVIRSRPWGWGNKKLKIDKDGAFVRERGRFRKTRESLSRDAESRAVVSGFEKESFRKKTTERYRDGGLLSKNVTRKDGSYEENWERSKGGTLIRTKYSTSRVRDGGLFRSISEDLSATDANGYRTLTREKGGLFKNKKVFETDENGENLKLVGRRSRTFSKYSTISKNRDFANVDIRHFGGLFSKSYSSRLDANGDPISKDIGARRKFLSKRSLAYEEGQLKSRDHTFGGSKLYKHSVDYTAGDGLKTVKKKLFGVTISNDTVDLSPSEIAANDLRKGEAQEHNALWKAEIVRREAAQKASTQEETARESGITVHPVPTPGTTMRLGTTPVLSKPSVNRGRFPFASGVEFPTTPTPSIKQLGSSGSGLDPAQSKPQAHGLQDAAKINSAAPLAPEDEEEAFLRSLGPSSPSKTASSIKSTDPKTNALLADWKPVGDNEVEKMKPPSRQSSVTSRSGSPERQSTRVASGPDAEEMAMLNSWAPVVRDAGRGNQGETGTDAAARRGFDQRGQRDQKSTSLADW
jgi:hypothetical protein